MHLQSKRMLKWPLQKVSNHREPLREPCPLCLRGAPDNAGRARHEVQPVSFYRGQMTLVQVASFGHEAQLACSAELSQQRVPRGLEVSVSRSGPPRPTDSEQRGQRRGPRCRATPLQTKTHPQRKHDREEEERKNRKTSRPCAPFERK